MELPYQFASRRQQETKAAVFAVSLQPRVPVVVFVIFIPSLSAPGRRSKDLFGPEALCARRICLVCGSCYFKATTAMRSGSSFARSTILPLSSRLSMPVFAMK